MDRMGKLYKTLRDTGNSQGLVKETATRTENSGTWKVWHPSAGSKYRNMYLRDVEFKTIKFI